MGDQDLITALRSLNEPGLAAADIPDDSPLLALSVVVRSAPTGASSEHLRQAFRDVLPLVIATDLAGLDRLVCEPLFGLGDWEGEPYGKRLDEIERLTGSNWDLAFRKRPLTMLLRALANALVETKVVVTTAQADIEPPSHSLVRFSFSQRFEMEPEPLRRTLEERVFRAERDGVDGHTVQARTRRIDRYGRMHHIDVYGADDIVLEDEVRTRDGVYWDTLYTYRVLFGRALEVGEVVRFAVSRSDDTVLRHLNDEDDRGWLGAFITVNPCEFEAQVVFPPGHLPTNTYWYGELPLSGEPSRDASRRLPLRGRTLTYRFPSVQLGHRYGVIWNW